VFFCAVARYFRSASGFSRGTDCSVAGGGRQLGGLLRPLERARRNPAGNRAQPARSAEARVCGSCRSGLRSYASYFGRSCTGRFARHPIISAKPAFWLLVDLHELPFFLLLLWLLPQPARVFIS